MIVKSDSLEMEKREKDVLLLGRLNSMSKSMIARYSLNASLKMTSFCYLAQTMEKIF